jgi:hypothetical protein
MQCPSCGQHTPDSWKKLVVRKDFRDQPVYTLDVPGPYDTSIPRQDQQPDSIVVFDWMVCANGKCHDLVVRMHETREIAALGPPLPDGQRRPTTETETHTWVVRPRFSTRPIPREVGEPFRTDYAEAAALLDISPRMSAVLARRLIGDLLKKYAEKKHWSLTARIRSFTNETGHPSGLTSNLDHLREIADFGAHTQEAEQQTEDGELEVVIVDADRDDAEWTLDLVDRMFDYFIVQPAKDDAMKDKWNKNISRTGRKPLGAGEETE